MSNLAQNKFAEQSIKALFQMMINIENYHDAKPSIKTDLFDKLILPALHYASEIGGFNNAPAIKRVHTKFCKRILGVRTTAQNDFVSRK